MGMANKLYAMEQLTEEVAKDIAAKPEEWMRFLDTEIYIGTFKVPLLHSGFRMVVFSVVIMVVVLFFRKGIMGDRELPQVIAGWKEKSRAKKAAKQEVTSK